MGIWPISRDHMGRGPGMTLAPQILARVEFNTRARDGWGRRVQTGGSESDTSGYRASKNTWCGRETDFGYDMDNRYPWSRVFFYCQQYPWSTSRVLLTVNTREIRDEPHWYCWQQIPVRTVRFLTGIAHSEIPLRPVRPVRHLMGIAQIDTFEADTPKQDGANLSVFVYYDINETCAANLEKRKAWFLVLQSFSSIQTEQNMDSPSF